MKNPLVSIIIVNWNGKELLLACLNSLTKITYPNFEIIVVDNGSSDGSVELVQSSPKEFLRNSTGQAPFKVQSYRSKLKVIRNDSNLGFAEGNNIGAKQAKGDYLLLLNNDTEVEPDFLERLVQTMAKDKKNAVVQPKIILTSVNKLQAGGSFLTHSGFLYHFGFFKDPNDPKYNKEMKIFSANGACMLIKNEVVKKIGLFDKDFFNYFEESDFCWRVILSGENVVYCPSSVIYHKGRQTSKRLSYSVTQYASFKNRLQSILFNLGGKEMVKMLPLHLVYSFFQAFGFLAMGKLSCAWAIPRAWWWNIKNLSVILEKRKFVQSKIRKVSDREFMPIYIKHQNFRDYLLFFYKPWWYKEKAKK